jgi:hypothetical protein
MKCPSKRRRIYEIFGFHGSDDHGGLLGCDAVWTCRWVPAIWRNILPPPSAPKSWNHLQVHMVSQSRRPPWTEAEYLVKYHVLMHIKAIKRNIPYLHMV